MSNAMLAVKYAGADPHPSRGFPACPWKICVAASRLPCLLCLYADGAMAGECFPFLFSHVVGIFVSALCSSLILFFLFMTKQTHIRRKPFSTYVGPLLCLRYVSKGEPPKARRKTVREYRQAHRTRPAFVAGQFVRAASIFVQPSSYPLPGPAPPTGSFSTGRQLLPLLLSILLWRRRKVATMELMLL